MKMTAEQYNQIKVDYVENIKRFIKEVGGVFPHFTVFAKKLRIEEDEKEDAIIHIPVPNDYMDEDDKKDMLVDEILPSIYGEICKTFKPYAISWASEAWLRTATDKTIKDYKTLPVKKEVVLITIDGEFGSEMISLEILRKGTIVNDDGEMIDDIQLIDYPELSGTNNNIKDSKGRFCNLFKKLNDTENDV